MIRTTNLTRLMLENGCLLAPVCENYIVPTKDVYYRVDEFRKNTKENNILFILGLSGSGKSTLADKIKPQKYYRMEHIDLDDIMINYRHRTLDDLQENNHMLYAWFCGPGQKYWIELNDIKNMAYYKGWCERHLNDFLRFAKSFAKLHSEDCCYTIEGVYLYRFLDPKDLLPYSVIIKGTSAMKSLIQAGKRDDRVMHNLSKIAKWFHDDRRLETFRMILSHREDEHKHGYYSEQYGISEDYTVKFIHKIAEYLDKCDQFKYILGRRTDLNEPLPGDWCSIDVLEENHSICFDMSALMGYVFTAVGICNMKPKDRSFAYGQNYIQAVRRITPYINAAIMYTIANSNFEFLPPSRLNIEIKYDRDIGNNIFYLKFDVKGCDDGPKINDIPLKEVEGMLVYENALSKLSEYASEVFAESVMSNPSSLARTREEIRSFINENSFIHEDYSGTNSYTGEEIAANEYAVHDLLYRIDEACKIQIEHNPVVTLEATMNNEFFAEGKLFTNLSLRDYIPSLKAMKLAYIKMVTMMGTPGHERGIYVPGWDEYDWKQDPAEFFDTHITNMWTTKYNGDIYSQLCITIADFDVAKIKEPQYKVAEQACSQLIPDQYKLENIGPNQVGWYIMVVPRAISLYSNHFLYPLYSIKR